MKVVRPEPGGNGSRNGYRGARRAGFTLLEILLAVVILTLLLSGVYAVLLGTVQAVERVELVTQRAEIGPGILRVVARDFEHAVIPGGQVAGAFAGKSQGYGAYSLDRVDFVANVSALGPPGADGPPRPSPMNEVGYRLEPNPFAPGLFKLFRREGWFVEGDPLAGGMLYEVYDRVRSFGLEYFDGKKWHRDWSSADAGSLPMAVRVGLSIEVGTEDTSKAEGQLVNVRLLNYLIIVMIPR